MIPTRPPDDLSAAQRLEPRVRWAWIGTGLIGVSPLVVVCLVLAIVATVSDWGGVAVTVAALLVATTIVAAVVIGALVRYRSWSWSLTDEGLRLTHGVVRRVESTIPGFRVQQVDISRGPIERMVGLATLTLSTASSTSDGTLPGVDADRVEDLRRRLLVDLSIDDGV